MCSTQVNINFDICDRLLIELNIQSERFKSNFLFSPSVTNAFLTKNNNFLFSWFVLIVFRYFHIAYNKKV